ncbi:mitochondrial fission ELM1 family protein [Microvirga sp. W0021]|uniref:Mitochondrial fission ELM1 family protein n=1 Tax=Hohaiivirga grylli TaxID=3133970 RepID=A0ABV0BJV3_9HYPH
MLIWVLTDGKAGDEVQCLGVAEELGGQIELRHVAARAPWSWLAPWGPVSPSDRPGHPESPIRAPFPDCAIASGRQAVPFLRLLKKLSPKTYTVFLKDPKTGADTADLIWVPEHDSLRGENVMTSITPPHRLTAAKLQAARRSGDPRLDKIKSPRVAVLVGGKSQHHHFTATDISLFIEKLQQLITSGAHLMITASRRTPSSLISALEQLVKSKSGHFLWDGTGDNPYLPMLATADYIVATTDSFNMIGEATATGKPILAFEPSGGHPKLSRFIAHLVDYGAVHPLTGHLEGRPYNPLDVTQLIACRIKERMADR